MTDGASVSAADLHMGVEFARDLLAQDWDRTYRASPSAASSASRTASDVTSFCDTLYLLLTPVLMLPGSVGLRSARY